MNSDYQKWYSPSLGHDMELKVYGYHGKPLVVFPAQEGRFFDFENFGMINAIAEFIEGGQIKVFCVDSIDNQTWANWHAHPSDRARRHNDYDRYLVDEVAPFIRHHCNETAQKFIATGASLGAFHAVNTFFRHPETFDGAIGLSGVYDMRLFVGDYEDDNVYFNSPLAYLPNLTDPWYLDQYRQSQIVICAGQGAYEEEMLNDARELQAVLAHKNIPAWVDLWGYDVFHDWPWWQKMLPYFLGKLDLTR